MATKKVVQVRLPAEIAHEISDAAQKTRRSVSFIVQRALAAAGPVAAVAGGDTALALTTDDDDPADLGSRIKKLAGDRPLDGAIAAAWAATRARFAAFIAREVAAQSQENADDLDAALAVLADPKATPARLASLAASDYVRVRTLLAEHPNTDAATLAKLGEDKDRVVRAALAKRTASV